MKFSIVIPAYNCASTIQRAIESILHQNHSNTELILVDGKSTDETIKVANQYRKYFSHFISEPDSGQTDAINKGFRLASGDIFNWLCGDDAYHQGAFDYIERIFSQNPRINFIAGATCRKYPNGASEICTPAPDVFSKISLQNGLEQPACFWRRDIHQRAGILDETLRFGMDWDWWNRIKAAGVAPFITTTRLADYYFPTESKTSSNPHGNLAEAYKIIKKYGPFNGGLADIYMSLFNKYDLQGCYDSPPSASDKLMHEFWRELAELVKTWGEDAIYSYNWNWISRQLRGLGWK
jgi:glycosyltransferase involved in cell wall biosynthesis